MKKIMNISLIGLLLLMSVTFTFGNDKDYWGQLPSERYMEENINGLLNTEISIDYFDDKEPPVEYGISGINPNDDDYAVGGRIMPIGDNLTILILLSLTYLMYKHREKTCFAKRYRFFK